jgi:hypothetical protein
VSGSRALGTLLAGLVDYAGLFPPAALGMPEAVASYGRYAAGDHRTMLGRFVLPATRLDEFAVQVRLLPRATAPRTDRIWRVAVLGGASDADAIVRANARFAGAVVVDVIEATGETPGSIAALAPLAHRGFTVYVEIAVREDPTALIAAIKAHGLRAKIRTGGVTPEAFPAPSEVLRFLASCTYAGVPFKATAGLHHPLRGEYALTYAPDAARVSMYGFLNIFLAAALLRSGAAPEVVARLLEEREASAITVSDDAIAWRAQEVPLAALVEMREHLAASFGSCSFEEPVQDLTSLGLL